jgi:hypothetical protein
MPNIVKLLVVASLTLVLSSCDNANVYGSIGISSGYSSYNNSHRGYSSGPRMRGSISIGGRIR